MLITEKGGDNVKTNMLKIVKSTIILITLLALINCVYGADTTNKVHVHQSNMTFDSIQDAINDPTTHSNYTIEINPGTYYENLIISKNVSLKGMGKQSKDTKISGSNIGRVILILNPNAVVYLENLEITEGKAPNGKYTVDGPRNGEDGGGIFNYGTLYINNCIITNNNAGNGANGGAYGKQGQFDVYHNKVWSAGNGGNGGGICSIGTLIINNSTIENNSAGHGGNGCHDYLTSSRAIYEPQQRSFAGKGGNGGGIYAVGILSINDSSINSNTAGLGGVGGYGQPDYYSVIPTPTDGGDGGNGGGIYYNGTNLYINKSIFQSNKAGNGGKGLSSEDLFFEEPKLYAYMSGSAGGHGGNGGAIFINSNGSSQTINTIKNTSFIENHAGNGGNGGNGSSTTTISYGGWNGGNGANGGNGGAIYLNGAGKIQGSYFTRNYAGAGGNGGNGGNGAAFLDIFATHGGNGGNGGNSGQGGAISHQNTQLDQNAKLEFYYNNVYNNYLSTNGAGGSGGLGGGSLYYNIYRGFDGTNGIASGAISILESQYAVANINYNRIYQDDFSGSYVGTKLPIRIGTEIDKSASHVDLNDNWWGTNSNPVTTYRVLYSTPTNISLYKWLIMTLKINGSLVSSYPVNITADLTKNNLGETVATSALNDLLVQFTTTQGSIDPNAAIENGKAIASFTPSDSGYVTIKAGLDDETISINNYSQGKVTGKFQNDLSYVVGDNATIILVLKNTYNSNATNVTVKIGGISGFNVSVSKGIYDSSTGIWYIDHLDPGEIVTMTLKRIITRDLANSQIKISGTLKQAEFPDIIENLQTTLNILPMACVTLNSTKNITLNVNEPVTIIFKLKNTGPNAGHNIKIKIGIPDGFTVLVTKGSYDATTRTWSIDSLDFNEEAQITIFGKFNKSFANKTFSIYAFESQDEYTQEIQNTSTNIHVKPIVTTISTENKKGTKGNTIKLTAHLVDNESNSLEGKTVWFSINGKIVGSSITDSAGIATFLYNITEIPKTYTLKVQFIGDENYTSSTSNGTLTVIKIKTTSITSNATGINKDNTTLTAKLTDKDGNPLSGKTITFRVNGYKIGTAITDSNGIATINYIITHLSGIYGITATFEGDENYTSTNSRGNLVVNQSPTVITVSNRTGIHNGIVKLTAKLTDKYGTSLSNKTIIFKIDGVYIGKSRTNINGIATLSYNATHSGNYVINATFINDTNYLASMGYAKLHINPGAKLYLKITSNKKDPKIGENFVIKYKLGNYGPDSAKNVTISFKIPQGLEFVDMKFDSGTASYNRLNRSVTWTINEVPVGDPYLYLTVKCENAGTYYIIPKINSDTYNWNAGNQSSFSIQIRPSKNSTHTASTVSKTVRMHKTGVSPVALILAILSLLTGMIVPLRKKP